MDTSGAPTFFLYGEPPRAAGAGFLHLEALDLRSRRSGWSIRPHRHADLNHVFFLTEGGGDILLDSGALAFEAPCLLFIPSGVDHGFAFQRESVGHVLTVASGFMERRPACAEAAADLFGAPTVIGCSTAADALQKAISELALELGWLAPGHSAAVESLILQVFVLALRLRHQARADAGGEPGSDEALLARYREQVELRFREPRSLAAYAVALGVSLTRLHRACRRAASCTPLQIIQARRLLEAERALLYSDMSIAEIAVELGFDDAAYFSRFFARGAGCTARAFRKLGSASAGPRPGTACPVRLGPESG